MTIRFASPDAICLIGATSFDYLAAGTGSVSRLAFAGFSLHSTCGYLIL